MRSNYTAGLWRQLAPGVAIAVLYAAFFAVPQRRELRRICDQSRSESVAVSELESRLRMAMADRATAAAAPARLVAAAADDLADDASRTEPFARTLARALEVFRSHGVDCTSSRSDTPQAPGGALVQRVELAGGFEDMLAAVEALADAVPQAVPVGLTLSRPRPSQACRWEFTFRFEGGGL